MSIDTSSTPGRTLAVYDPSVDHDLADVLFQHNIAVGTTATGSTLLVRPDSALVRVPQDREARGRLAEAAGRFDPSARRNLASSKTAGTVVTVRLGKERSLAAEHRWGLDAVNSFLLEGQGVWSSDYNAVVLGAQTFIGSPLGANAAWAGEIAFPGGVYRDAATGRVSLRNTAEPAFEPVPWRAPLALSGRPRPRVLVLDTGLRTIEVAGGRARAAAGGGRRPEHQKLAQCGVPQDWRIDKQPGVVDDEDEEFDVPAHALVAPDDTSTATSTSRLLDFEAGHGTFIAGLILQICPDAEIVSGGVLSSFGAGDASGILATLGRMQSDHGPFDIVVMSFGANLADDEPGVFGEELKRLLGDSLGVAAAGNQSTCRPYFPAALPGVIGVGALQADGKAWFTNFGGWVDACAPGVDVVSTFFENFDEVLDGETTRQYRGWARWSGTSFSAPKVAAVIAQEQYLFGGTAKEAWKRLSSHKHFHYPDLGIAFNV